MLLGLGLVLSSYVQDAWQLYVTFGLPGGRGSERVFYVPLTVLAIKWFEGRRGMAASVVSARQRLGILALAPLTRWLINEFDWRVAFLVLGNLAWVVVLPTALLLRPPGGQPAGGGQPSGTLPSSSSSLSNAGPEMAPASPVADNRLQLRLRFSWLRFGLPWASWRSGYLRDAFLLLAARIRAALPSRQPCDGPGRAQDGGGRHPRGVGLTSIFGRIGTGIVARPVGAKHTLSGRLSLQAR